MQTRNRFTPARCSLTEETQGVHDVFLSVIDGVCNGMGHAQSAQGKVDDGVRLFVDEDVVDRRVGKVRCSTLRLRSGSALIALVVVNDNYFVATMQQVRRQDVTDEARRR